MLKAFLKAKERGSETHLLVLFAIVVYNGARHSVAERLSSVVLIIVKKI